MLSSIVRQAATPSSWGRRTMVRHLHVHEYISMEIMKEHGIATPRGYVASTPEEAENLFLTNFNKPGEPPQDAVLKAQVLTSGRGLGHFAETGFQGGVHMVSSPEQAREYAAAMLGHKLKTQQDPEGRLCTKVWLTERVYMRREMYLSIVMDRISQGPVLVASSWGGTSTQHVAANNREAFFMEPIDVMDGLQDDTCDRMASNLCLEGDSHDKAVTLMKNLYEMFTSCDCTLIEVNPLAETPEGDVIVLDAKVNFDDNAAYRQPSIFARRDLTQMDAREVKAKKHDLDYIGMEGNIGCMVNGAGLAMSTMDIIQLNGGSPANFLDVGGGANETQVQMAFEILNSDPRVQAILVNIFGGLMRCDVIATGMINAAKEIGIQKPIVIRLQGTNVEEAKTLIDGCGFHMNMADDLEDAAVKVVGVADIVAKASKIQVGIKFDGLEI